MKKILLLSALSLSLFGCGDEQEIQQMRLPKMLILNRWQSRRNQKAIMPEEYLKDVAFIKNERGTVIFGNLQDMLL